jgi:hypothetical protein
MAAALKSTCLPKSKYTATIPNGDRRRAEMRRPIARAIHAPGRTRRPAMMTDAEKRK